MKTNRHKLHIALRAIYICKPAQFRWQWLESGALVEPLVALLVSHLPA